MEDFTKLQDRAKSSGRKTIAVAAAHDLHTLEALFDAVKAFGADYILTGDREKILRLCEELGQDLDTDRVLNTSTDEESAAAAVSCCRSNADVLMKGILQTSTLLRAVLDKEKGIRGSNTMSHLAVVQSPAYHKLLYITDGGMNPHPDISQKADILNNAVAYLKTLGIVNPCVAALAAVESVSAGMPETADAAELMRINQAGGIKDCIVEGPLSLDLAVSRESAEIKGVESRVSGEADILLMPDIASGNIMTKALCYLGGAKMAGCVLGAKTPVVLVSRGASAEEKRLSIMLCLSGG